ncbi:MAG: hypothetical protein LZF85_10200 [Nitrosomonas sp.]|uniref:hypothetical protein n=1 Tax=Nitrosomonas sp. TaxID=42353 RepID=UPI0025D15B6A|nr:hypothetical protein [Nitrosomonas sp.]UJP02145.1 MAG: hypothetical protein LZF85_10200 [Nitrosomonas sp.]
MNHQSDLSVYEKMVTNPLAPMTLRIGVAGHRALPHDQLPRLREEVSAIYADIHRIMQQTAAAETAAVLYDKDTKPVIRIISSLAEGADRLCIDPDLIAFEHELACILPFLKEEFERDFLPENSAIDNQQGTMAEFNAILERTGYGQADAQVIELDGNPDNRDEAYNHCSQLLAAHSDILIAVYDGDDSKNTGTAAAVKAAKCNGVPVIHISTLADTPPQLHCSTRFGHEPCDIPCTTDLLQKELQRVLLFSDLLDQAGSDNKIDPVRKQKILARFKQYQAEANLQLTRDRPDFDDAGPIILGQKYKNKAAEAFDFLKKKIASPEKIQEELKRLKKAAGDSAATEKSESVEQQRSKPSLNRYFAAYLRADRLANYYASSHRSIFVLIYLLGAAALITAATALLFQAIKWVVLLCVVFELAFLMTIFVLYWHDHRQKYHDRWLEYRCLAEFLRPMRYLSLLGSPYAIGNLRDTGEYLHREVIGHSAVGRSWLYIYTETINRWAGFNACRLDTDCKHAVSHFIRTTWLNGQISYHTYNAAAMRIVGHSLGRLSFGLFVATVLIVILKLIIVGRGLAIDPEMAHGLIADSFAWLAAILPTLAATAYAIRNHAEFDISAQRSLSMRTALISRRKQLMPGRAILTSSQMAMILSDIATVTIKETADWLEIYEVKESELG